MYGGTITSDIGNLAIPLGLILSHAGLEKLMARDGKGKGKSKSKSKSSDLSTQRRTTLSLGGAASPRRKSPKGKDVTKAKAKAKAKKGSSPVRVRKSALLTRTEQIRVHFQDIARKVQDIFLKARRKQGPKTKKSNGRKAA